MSVIVSDFADARDRDLLKRIASRDEDAFRELFARYAPTAFAMASRMLRAAALAEEVVQETLLSVWTTPERFDASRGTVRAWLMTQVHHRAVDTIRREESQRRRADDLAAEPEPIAEDPGVVVVDELSLPREREALRQAMAMLPQEQRRVLDLMYFGARTQSQVAQSLGIPLGTVKSRALLGMRKMRSVLEEERA